MTAREDRILVAYVSMTTHCGGNIGPPLLQSILYIKYLKMHFNRILKKGRSYVSSARGHHWDECQQHSVFPCYYFTSFEIATARSLFFSLPLLLFHSIWTHNSKGSGHQSPLAVTLLHSKSNQLGQGLTSLKAFRFLGNITSFVSLF